ncbi:MAG: cardiolipin synthase [Oscillospiraceae bacterium]|nr:cardiolipin synthase [Oscillospiraceae bacterium]
MSMEHKSIKDTGLRLLKKGQKGIIHAIFSRFGIIILLFFLQAVLLLAALFLFQSFLSEFFFGGLLIGFLVAIYILNSSHDPSAKLTWIILVMALPVFGTLLYLYTEFEVGHRSLRDRVSFLVDSSKDKISRNPEVSESLRKTDPGAYSISRYLERTGSFSVFDGTEVSYLPIGEDTFDEMLLRLEKARHFIFLEYFIIDEGIMWGKILEILARKVKEGVDVRLIYDGTNEFTTLPRDYPEMLRKLGIKCKVFAPLTPFISTHYNYRDHRKIMVIDGNTAFTGGINFADRYINRETVHGHWKDTAVMLRGKAVKGFTLMFLQMWNIDEKEPEFDYFLSFPSLPPEDSEGFVIPYGDCPLDKDKIGEMVYMDILNRAKRYVHIMTPYLILDGEMETAIRFAAERGVEVKIILPGVPDKLAPYSLAKSHYSALLDSGVQIYEYKPGFIHAKSFVADDIEGVVGTINLDYRSLYHHFECAAYCYGTSCIGDIEKDFQETLEKSRRITKENIWKNYPFLRPVSFFVKIIAPLL